MAESNVFEPAQKLPSPDVLERYERLVGLEEFQQILIKEATLLLAPDRLEKWSRDHHNGAVIGAVKVFSERLPLFIFAGDVGTGKTELAETFGDSVARRLKLKVTVMKLSLTARGTGKVGEMTTLLSNAFSEIEERLAGQRGASKPSSAVVLIIDEADAIAQSREMADMHHEDRAGVNAVIRSCQSSRCCARIAQRRLTQPFSAELLEHFNLRGQTQSKGGRFYSEHLAVPMSPPRILIFWLRSPVSRMGGNTAIHIPTLPCGYSPML
jgi:hypothetical protein